MIITDYTKVIETLNTLLEKEFYINIDIQDIDRLFPDKTNLRLINVAGNDENAVIEAFKKDYALIGEKPRAVAEFILSKSLTMSGLNALNNGIPAPDACRRAIQFETGSAGSVEFYYFYL